ncbi:phospholipase D-like domain-containing protein [Kribbella shirazensis]|uniref:phospholipase D n=1 Tax=Kribbella shirazensis TaxID=1105143 RepID=A0A7X5VFH9_9ACTN|nr:phospholipase D-like domain-containing protein [Kribbella shirazensis]NIK59821.1 phosphatidylserine/phosphatidylglycerophosphate/cardiolipin synthase-like enzyme [Kribbella shirazensis]
MKPSDLVKGLVVAATTCALVYGGGAQAAGTAEQKENAAPDKPTMFVDNDPNGSTSERYRIRDYLVNLINGAEKDSVITIASYRFDDYEIAKALIAKIKTHRVTVKIIVDAEHRATKPYRDVKYAADESRLSWITYCTPGTSGGANKRTSCIGDHIMHNKFYLFSKTRGQSNVVVQTSSNLSEHSGPKMWNTAFTAMGNDGEWLYNKYQEYFFDLNTEEKRKDQYQHFIDEHGPVSNAKYKLYVSPRPESSSNVTFANILKSVKCDGNSTGGTNDKEHRTIVRVAAAQIAKGGGAAVAAQLWRLDNEGCYVDVVGTDVSQAKDGPLRGGLLRAPTGKFHGPEVREFSTNQCGTHEKNILIDGNYAGKPDQKVVFTGSHNLNRKSPWHNDDVILRIIDADVHEKFKDHFFKIRAAAAVTWQTSKYETTDPDDFKFNC